MYFLERKEPYAMPNILGGKSFPVPTYRWKQVAMSEDKEVLEQYRQGFKSETRIVNNQEVTA